MFRGHFEHTIDPKGRLSIPAKFRDALQQDGQALVIVPNGEALAVYPLRAWEEIEARVAALSKFDRDAREIKLQFLSLGQDVAIDPQGRIQIAQHYRERAGLTKDVVIVGMLEYFEVWDAERLAHRQRERARPLDELMQRLADKGV